ncbi:MAG: S-methyl-5'-thioadenosine phosphorylase [Candidatus Coatesbacteria bacterium]|nr:MAG: S-methyl-5'-thioadenosine phosphorylase [Candidatus Coatesbacteria bacterium]
MSEAATAVIGGSGLYEIEGFDVRERRKVETPFGDPSDEFVIGAFAGAQIVFLPRHGAGHRHPAGAVNYRANIWGLKALGVNRVLSVSAVGSLKAEIEPRQFVIPDQFYDNTKRRLATFFDDTPTAHVGLADPYCEEVRRAVGAACESVGVPAHTQGTYLCMEGPQFSTRAESNAYRQLGFDVIGMTSATEAKLAREAEMCYATVALVTDYDCWFEAEDVTIGMVLENMRANVANVKAVIAEALPAVAALEACACHRALEGAILTDLKLVPAEVVERLRPLLAKYL